MATDIRNGIALPLMESFYTIQGEGVYSGHPAYFIRLAGCDVGCVWCDVKASWDADVHPVVAVKDIVAESLKYPAKMVVITGGEPLMYKLDNLIDLLRKQGKLIHIETSGAHPLIGEADWICLSPKKFAKPKDEIYRLSNELKVIVFNKHDFKWAEAQAAKVNDNCALLLQPEWSKEKEMLPLIINFVKDNPKWRISLQTHKYMDIP